MLGGLGVYATSVITLPGAAIEFDIVIRSFDDAGNAVDTNPQTVSP